MKTVRLVILSSFLLLGLSCSTTKNKPTNEEQMKALHETVDSGDYTIDVSMAYPARGKSVSLTSSYSLKVKNDSVFSHLPFYGRAYSVPYGGGKGLVFDAPITDYTVSYNKKGAANIRFTTRTSEDVYRFTVEIFPGGSAGIQVNMQQRAPMRYSGRLDR